MLQDLTRQALALGAEKLELQEMLAQQGAELDDALAARGAAAAAAAAAAARAQALSRQARAPAPATSAEGAGKVRSVQAAAGVGCQKCPAQPP